MMHTLEELARLTNSSFDGDSNTQITTVAALDEAEQGQISFVSNPKYINKLAETSASAVILDKDLAESYQGNVLINNNPYLTFAHVLQILYAEPKSPGIIHKSATVADDTKIHQSAKIGPNVVIESGVIIDEDVIVGSNSVIGRNSRLYKGVQLHSNVTLYKDTKIGQNSIIHSGVVIGSDGFGFAPTDKKEWYKILHIGNVVIGDDVEIGANTTIDRGALGTTHINNGVKLDNLIHIAHNVKIDEYTAIAAGTVIAGSTIIGKRCQIGGAVAIAGHLNVVDDVIFTGRSMVMKSVKKPGVYSSGIATDENKKWRRNAARFRSLDEMAKKIRYLEQKLNEK